MGTRFEYDDRGELCCYDDNTGEYLGKIVTMGDLQPEVERLETNGTLASEKRMKHGIRENSDRGKQSFRRRF